MSTYVLTGNCGHLEVSEAIRSFRYEEPRSNSLTFDIQPHCFLQSSAIGLIVAWGLSQGQGGTRIAFRGDRDTLRYLSRMDVFDHLSFDFEETFERHDETGRFLPVELVEDIDSVFRATEAICELVIQRFDNASRFLPALEWCVGEIIDNVRVHADAESPGVVCAQYYPRVHRLDISIVDQGRGIKSSLEERLDLWSHGDAITRALERGMTRDPNIGQGNGMAGTLEIIRKNGGDLEVWTGDANFHVENGVDRGFSQIPLLPGTGVFIRMDTRHPVQLSDTFIGDAGWSYIDYKAEQIEESGGLKVASECRHSLGRETARPFRRKIESLLPSLEGTLVLDFSDVQSATSSYLDELLGRLAASLGESQFRRKIHLVNISDDLLAMANVVIGQRLNSGEG